MDNLSSDVAQALAKSHPPNGGPAWRRRASLHRHVAARRQLLRLFGYQLIGSPRSAGLIVEAWIIFAANRQRIRAQIRGSWENETAGRFFCKN